MPDGGARQEIAEDISEMPVSPRSGPGDGEKSEQKKEKAVGEKQVAIKPRDVRPGEKEKPEAANKDLKKEAKPKDPKDKAKEKT
jgi:hypothetical protein